MILACMGMIGCVETTTMIYRQHHLLNAGSSAIAVAFIRPNKRPGGYAKPLEIQLDGESLINLAKGQYTYLYIKPGTYEMVLTNWTVEPGDTTQFQTSRYFTLELPEADPLYLLFTAEKITFGEAMRQVGRQFADSMAERVADEVDRRTTPTITIGEHVTVTGSPMGPSLHPNRQGSGRGWGFTVDLLDQAAAMKQASELEPVE